MNFPYYPYQPQMIPQVNNQPQQQMQSGLITVHTEDEALRYPVAPGNSIMFKIENQPVVIEKTMGFSQLESPKIERFRLEREDAPQEKPTVTYALAEDIERIDAEIEKIKAALPKRPAKKREDSEDE